MSKRRKKTTKNENRRPSQITINIVPQKRVKKHSENGVFYIDNGIRKPVNIQSLTGDANNMVDLKTAIFEVDKRLGRNKSGDLFNEIEKEVEEEFPTTDKNSDEFKRTVYNRFKNEIITAYNFLKK